MCFKPTAKTLVLNAVKKFYGQEKVTKSKVNGDRLPTEECKRRGWPNGTFFAELVVDGNVVATARSCDWRKAYKMLALEVDKLYADGKDLV